MTMNGSYDIREVRDFLVSIGLPDAKFGAQRTYIFGTQALAPGAISVPKNIKFRQPVVALGILGQVSTGLDADYAASEFRLQFGSQEDAWDDGYGAGLFAPMLMLFGRFNKPSYDFVRPRFARAGITYTATFQNVSGAATFTPTTGVRVIELDPASVPKNFRDQA